jgi:hypothetical protein
MNAAPATDARILEGHHIEWQLLRERPCNLLLEGTVTATDAVLRLLQPNIGEPIARHQPPATLDLASGATRALILSDAAALSGDEQRRLLAWMGDAGSRAQIITTASRPLFPLVEAGLFDAALYYRLNVLLLRVTSPFQSESPCGGAERVPRHDSPSATSTSPFV